EGALGRGRAEAAERAAQVPRPLFELAGGEEREAELALPLRELERVLAASLRGEAEGLGEELRGLAVRVAPERERAGPRQAVDGPVEAAGLPPVVRERRQHRPEVVGVLALVRLGDVLVERAPLRVRHEVVGDLARDRLAEGVRRLARAVLAGGEV